MRVTMAALKRANTMSFIVMLAIGATITLSDGAPTFTQYPASPVTGAQGDNILLTFIANGTGEHDSIIIQGPNPLMGSNKFTTIYERGTGQANPHERFTGNFSVTTTWSGGTTVVNLTILDFQPGDNGTYRANVAHHASPEIEVTELIVPVDDVTVNATDTSQPTTGGPANYTTEPTGSTSGGGLPGWAKAVIVVASLIVGSVAIGTYLLYRRRLRNSRTPAQDPPVRYDPVKNGDADPNIQVLNGVGKQGGEVGAEELNGVI